MSALPTRSRTAGALALLRAFMLLYCVAPGIATAQDACLDAVPCKELVDSGQLLSKSKKYDAALSAYETAHQKWPVPWLLVNIGRMQQKLGQLDAAAMNLREYLAKSVAEQDDKTRARASEYLTQVEDERSRQKIASVQEPKSVPPPPPAEPPIDVVRPKPIPIHKRWWFWTSIGVVAAGAVIGGALAGYSREPNLDGTPIVQPFSQ